MTMNYWMNLNEDNPYIATQQIHSQLIGKILSNDAKNQAFFDQSSNSSLK
jgi:hypothetical protein